VNPTLGSILIYARDTQRTAEFYTRFFDFESSGAVAEGLITLTSPSGGAAIVIHQAAKSVKLGHVGVKLVFDVQDVEAFKVKSAALGLMFGATHAANGYSYANAKDPDKNSIAISSRAFRNHRTTHG
jgi:predicted enzyme related to lactoylglutathione lyase